MLVSFLWPTVLWGLLLIPALTVLYVRMMRRPPAPALAYPDTSRVALAAAHGRKWARHLPAALFLTGVAAVLVPWRGPSPAYAPSSTARRGRRSGNGAAGREARR